MAQFRAFGEIGFNRSTGQERSSASLHACDIMDHALLASRVPMDGPTRPTVKHKESPLTHSGHSLRPRPRPASGRRHETTSNCGAWTMRKAGRTDGRKEGRRTCEPTNECLALHCVQRASDRASSHSSSTGGGRRGQCGRGRPLASCNVTIVGIKSV